MHALFYHVSRRALKRIERRFAPYFAGESGIAGKAVLGDASEKKASAGRKKRLFEAIKAALGPF